MKHINFIVNVILSGIIVIALFTIFTNSLLIPTCILVIIIGISRIIYKYNKSNADVFTLTKQQYQKLLKENEINNETIHLFDMAVISINSIKDKNIPQSNIYLNGKNILNLFFDDYNITPEQVEELNRFIIKNKRVKTIFIHCYTGIVKSGTIAQYIVDKLNLDENEFKKNNPYIRVNKDLLNTLKNNR